MTLRRSLLGLGLAVLASTTGCAAAIDAAFRETDDHGRGARYESKSYGEHDLDAVFESDDDDCDCGCDGHGHHVTVVTIHEG